MSEEGHRGTDIQARGKELVIITARNANTIFEWPGPACEIHPYLEAVTHSMLRQQQRKNLARNKGISSVVSICHSVGEKSLHLSRSLITVKIRKEARERRLDSAEAEATQ